MMLSDQELQSLRNMGNEAEAAADEIQRLRAEVVILTDAVRSARADEAHCWASRVGGLTAQLREADARYMALLKSAADGFAMQPRTATATPAP